MNTRGTYLWFDNQMVTCMHSEAFAHFETANAVYEVLRIVDGVALFFEDHYARLSHSMQRTKVVAKPTADHLLQAIASLSKANIITNGNIRIDVSVPQGIFRVSFIPHVYPSPDMYQQGVQLVSMEANRQMPDVKQESVRRFITAEVDKLLHDRNCYEVALVEKNGEITEGSRSNLFFIIDGQIVTAPETQVLNGITRLNVLQLAHAEGITVIEKALSISELRKAEGAFLTGTSPKLLPINRFDDVLFSAQHGVNTLLMNAYDRLIHRYILSKLN